MILSVTYIYFMVRYFIIIWFILICPDIFCQAANESIIIAQVSEELAAGATDEQEAARYTEMLHDLVDDPVNINSSDPDELSRLFFLTDFQVKSLADYTRTTGRILSIYEIEAIPGFDRDLALTLAPFINLDDYHALSSYNGRWRNNFITSYSFRTTDRDTAAPGAPWRSLSRYRFTAGSLSGGFTAEKDAGEKFFRGNSLIPDFFSANICYTGNGIIRKIIAGDYSARSGQGTNFNTGIRTGLSLATPGYMAAKSEIKPYTSTDENNFFRGAAVSARFKNMAAFVFFSHNTRDAAIELTEGKESNRITGFYNTGLHNTQAGILKTDAVVITSFGTEISYDFTKIKVGLSGIIDRLSMSMENTSARAESLYDFSGSSNSVLTAFYNSAINKILLFGELSANGAGRHAFVQGLSLKPASRLMLNMLYRNYSPGYTSLHGKGPGMSSGTENEEGLLGNFSFEAAKHLYITGGCDITRYPWLKYRCSAPSFGIRKELLVRFSPSEKLTMEGLYTYRYSIRDSGNNAGIKTQMPLITRDIKTIVRYSLTEKLKTSTRIEYKSVNSLSARGYLLLQDLNFSPGRIPLMVWLRYCIFNTTNYDSRIYTYENDMLYSFSIPALSGSGSRCYIMIKWYAGKMAEIRIRYGITSISGNKGIPADREDFKMQLRLKF